VENYVNLHVLAGKPILARGLRGLNGGLARRFHTNFAFQGESRMARSSAGKAKAFFRTTPSGAFDQYLQDIQKLPLIKDPAEERRLARRVQRAMKKPPSVSSLPISVSSSPT